MRRVWIAIALLAVCGLGIARVAWRDYRNYLRKSGSDADAACDFVSRYEPLAEFLPPRGIVGYISPRSTGDIFIAQYALSPRLIERTPRASLVIYDNPDGQAGPGGTSEIALRERWTLVHDFGHGLKLYRTAAE